MGWYPAPSESRTRDEAVVGIGVDMDVVDFEYNTYTSTSTNRTPKLYDLSVDIGEYTDIASNYSSVVLNLTQTMYNVELSRQPPAPFNTSCPPPEHPVYPVVGGVWEPWC